MRAVLLSTLFVLGLSAAGALAQGPAEDPSLAPLPGLDLPGIEDLLPEEFPSGHSERPMGPEEFENGQDDPFARPTPAPEAEATPAPSDREVPPRPAPPPEIAVSPAERLDKLFADLKRESNAVAAARVARSIEAQWAESGSATVDLLVGWAGQAMAKDDKPAALDLLGEAIAMKPDFAESWNRRATLHFLADDYGKSLADIEQTLAREPRHYGALMGLGAILEETGRKPQALDAYTKVLEIYPTMKAAQDAVGRLSEELAGQAI